MGYRASGVAVGGTEVILLTPCSHRCLGSQFQKLRVSVLLYHISIVLFQNSIVPKELSLNQVGSNTGESPKYKMLGE